MSSKRERPPTPDQQGVDPGTWLWMLLALAIIAGAFLWASFR